MSQTPDTSRVSPPHLEVARARRRPPIALTVVVILLAVAGGLWASGVRPSALWSDSGSKLPTLVVDRGDVPLFVVESGALESANNATERCRVEAITGLVGGAQATQGTTGPRTNAAGGNMGAGGGAAGASVTPPPTPAPVPAKAAPKAGASGSAAAKTGTTSGSTTTAAAGTAGAATGTTAAAGAAGAGATPAPGGVTAPVIQSFTYIVEPHVPLRPAVAATKTTTTAKTKAAQQQQQQRQQGGGGFGGGAQEKSGSTRILTILPEGTEVKTGDIVCTLDSAAFRDELQAQKIRCLQAEAWVKQADQVLQVSKMSLREYTEGIYPKDKQLIDQYIAVCKLQLEGAGNTLAQSRKVFKQGLISKEQLKADELSLDKAEINLREARGMKVRLEQFTGPRLMKNLQAKVDAVYSDGLAQQEAYQLELTRRKKLESVIANCTMRAPRDGIVAYAVQGNPWGRRTEDQIQEGVTVREGQAIFNLPDPSRMRVKAKINETKLSNIDKGMTAWVRIDAFPDRVLTGTVAEVTAIPTAAMGPISDVKNYSAMVDLEIGGFQGLKPGMSAEVGFMLDGRRNVTRVPIQAIRWVGDVPYAAVAVANGHSWRRLELGLINPTHAEVVSGLTPGEKVVSNPGSLPRPKPSDTKVIPASYTASRAPRG
jgi:multidrug resistance efflux pump